jgi:hypothetical protein
MKTPMSVVRKIEEENIGDGEQLCPCLEQCQYSTFDGWLRWTPAFQP